MQIVYYRKKGSGRRWHAERLSQKKGIRTPASPALTGRWKARRKNSRFFRTGSPLLSIIRILRPIGNASVFFRLYSLGLVDKLDRAVLLIAGARE